MVGQPEPHPNSTSRGIVGAVCIRYGENLNICPGSGLHDSNCGLDRILTDEKTSPRAEATAKAN